MVILAVGLHLVLTWDRYIQRHDSNPTWWCYYMLGSCLYTKLLRMVYFLHTFTFHFHTPEKQNKSNLCLFVCLSLTLERVFVHFLRKNGSTDFD